MGLHPVWTDPPGTGYVSHCWQTPWTDVECLKESISSRQGTQIAFSSEGLRYISTGTTKKLQLLIAPCMGTRRGVTVPKELGGTPVIKRKPALYSICLAPDIKEEYAPGTRRNLLTTLHFESGLVGTDITMRTYMRFGYQ